MMDTSAERPSVREAPNSEAMSKALSSHPYLSGVHAPMVDEFTLTELNVTGTIPPALNGRYLRIGPNPIAPNPVGYHWFVGDGMIHGVAVKDGRALWYRNRWIRSEAVAAALGEPPAPGPHRGGLDTVNTNVVAITGRTFALVEAGAYPVELNDALDTQVYNPFDDTLAGSFTAHPHRDPLSGEYHAVAYEASSMDTVRYIVLAPKGQVLRETAVAVKNGPSIHDCAITGRFAVILDLPVTFSQKAAIGGHRFPYEWNPSHPARVGLLPRSGNAGDIVWCAVDPCYVFHVANAFDAPEGQVVMDVVAYDHMFADSLQGPDATGRFERWTIDPSSRTVERRVIDGSAQEFPRSDDRRFGQPYRYAYTVAIAENSSHFGGGTEIYKHDLISGGRRLRSFGKERFPGEFVFVPASAEAAEDEGWLIGLVIDAAQDTTDLLILDARHFEAEPVSTIRIPHRIPPGFHGNWLSDL